MITGPIGTYFLTLNTIFQGLFLPGRANRFKALWLSDLIGNSTFAGATAALMANIVLIAYVFVAIKEDESEKLAAQEKAKKGE